MKKLATAIAITLISNMAMADTSKEREVSIENVLDGTYITVYSNSKNNYLYGYSAYSYSNDQQRQNFYVSYTRNNKKDIIRFKYAPHNTCIRLFNDYIVDNDCDEYEHNDWEMLYTSTGAVQLKNVKAGKCLNNYSSGAKYSNYNLETCAIGNNIPRKQLWVVTAPRRDAKRD